MRDVIRVLERTVKKSFIFLGDYNSGEDIWENMLAGKREKLW